MTYKIAPLKIAGIAALSVAFFALAFYSGTFFYKKKDPELSRPAPKTFIAFEGFDPRTEIEANFIQNGKSTPLLVANKEFILPEIIKSGFSVPYEVKAIFKTPDDEYFDFTWTINWRGVEYNIVLDGFSPDDKAILMEGDEIAQNIPFDWSGKIEFPIILHQDEDKTVCVQIQHKSTEYGFCHLLTGKRDA